MNCVEKLKEFKRSIIKRQKFFWRHGSRYRLEGEIQNKEILLFVLAGYKEYLWDDVFSRIKQSQLPNMEVCIGSSGKYSEELSKMCKKNNWCYLSTSLNNMCVLTNIILRDFSKASFYFKLDEDIYIPKDYFKKMIDAYSNIESIETKYVIGYLCPNLPLGFYSLYDYLVEKNCLDDFESRFGKLRIGGSLVNPFFRNNMGIDTYIWNKIGIFDDEAQRYFEKGFSYSICPTRTGIAAILFRRSFWDRIECLKRPRGVGWGEEGDESQIASFCARNYLANFRVDNIIVGHFAFGGAEQNVLKLKQEHPDFFKMRD